MIVVADASALGEFVLRTERATAVERVVAEPAVELHVPALCDVGMVAILRRALQGRSLVDVRAWTAPGQDLALPLTRHGHAALLGRALALRDSFSADDAIDVALAERLHGQLLTADERLARAVRAHTSLALAHGG